MSVLSKSDLEKRLESGDLVVSPVLNKTNISGCSIDLRVGTVAVSVRARGLSHVDPKKYLTAESKGGYAHRHGLRQRLDRHDVPFLQEFILHPHMLTLVPTLEWVKVPNDLQGVVTARSSWAREGLNIATASFINPGYIGTITLELSNLGQIPITFYPGLRIAQIAFYNVPNPETTPAESQFNLSFEPHSGAITRGDEKFIRADED